MGTSSRGAHLAALLGALLAVTTVDAFHLFDHEDAEGRHGNHQSEWGPLGCLAAQVFMLSRASESIDLLHTNIYILKPQPLELAWEFAGLCVRLEVFFSPLKVLVLWTIYVQGCHNFIVMVMMEACLS